MSDRMAEQFASSSPEDRRSFLLSAITSGQDRLAAALLSLLPPGEHPPTTFIDLTSRDLVQSAVALARLESSSTDLTEAQPDTGGTYMHSAAAIGCSACLVEALKSAGCSINAHDEAGDTPLALAAAGGYLGTCKALVAAGADVLTRNHKGRTVRQQAGLTAEMKEWLADAEATEIAKRREQAERLFGSKIAATQTASALRVGCL